MNTKHEVGRSSRLTWADGAVLLLIAVLMIALCVLRSRTRLLWSDETYSFTLFREGALLPILKGWWAGVDSGGVVYYLLGVAWFHLVPLTPLNLRLLSTATLLGGVVLVWCAARRFFSVPVLTFAIGLACFMPKVMSWQMYNGRPYGLFFFGAAWASSAFLRTMSRAESRGFDGGTTAAHLCLVGSHLLGVVYSGALIAGMAATDRVAGRRQRWSVTGSALASWVLVLVSLHATVATTNVAKGIFWTKKPGLGDLPMGFFLYSRAMLGIALVLLVILSGLALARRRGWRFATAPERADGVSHLPVWTLIASLMAGQLVLFVLSQRGLSIYADRYLLPVGVATVLFFAECLTRLGQQVCPLRLQSHGKLPASAAVVALLLFAAHAFKEDQWSMLYPARDFPARLSAGLQPGVPVVVTVVPVFTLDRLFDPRHRYIFMTDWGYDLDPAHPLPDASAQRLMDHWRTGGLASNSVRDLPELVQQEPEFTLIADAGRTAWVRTRFGDPSKFDLKYLGATTEWYPLEFWQVHRVPGATR